MFGQSILKDFGFLHSSNVTFDNKILYLSSSSHATGKMTISDITALSEDGCKTISEDLVKTTDQTHLICLRVDQMNHLIECSNYCSYIVYSSNLECSCHLDTSQTDKGCLCFQNRCLLQVRSTIVKCLLHNT